VDAEKFGQASENLARYFGTAQYLVIQTAIVIVWILLNALVVTRTIHWDPYPFILLNLAFSTQAAYAAPLILLAQNRQADRDKVQNEQDRARDEQASPTPSTCCARWPRCGSRSTTWPPATSSAPSCRRCSRSWSRCASRSGEGSPVVTD
jgi:hypothetical protein